MRIPFRLRRTEPVTVAFPLSRTGRRLERHLEILFGASFSFLAIRPAFCLRSRLTGNRHWTNDCEWLKANTCCLFGAFQLSMAVCAEWKEHAAEAIGEILAAHASFHPSAKRNAKQKRKWKTKRSLSSLNYLFINIIFSSLCARLIPTENALCYV